MSTILTMLGLVLLLAIVGFGIYLGFRMGKGKAKLEDLQTEKPHLHIWSPWDDHEVALYDGADLVRYAPGQLRTCLDPSCNAEDVRYTGGQTTSGDKDLS
jgi:hypothetical protein